MRASCAKGINSKYCLFERSSMNWREKFSDLNSAIDAGNANGAAADLQRALREEFPPSGQIGACARMIAKLAAAMPEEDQYVVMILGDATTTPYAEATAVALAAEGKMPIVREGGYGIFRQEVLSSSSSLYSDPPDCVMLAVGLISLDIAITQGADENEVEAALENEVARWRALWTAMASRWDGPILQHLYPLPEQGWLGIAERRVPWSPRRYVDALNARLIEEAPGDLHWIDIDFLANQVGRQSWFDPRLYFYGKFTISPRVTDVYAAAVQAVWRSATGHGYKVLVTDLDNTLWGGVVGDDGLDGIELGPASAVGEAHEDFCRYLKELNDRGVILSVCSKNDPDIAVKPFLDHPHMPLNRDDFAAFTCNWESKAENLRSIAQYLNVATSTLVFIDDNPAEVELIRMALPEVRCLLMDGDPAGFVRQLDNARLFEAPFLSQDDLGRGASYAARRVLETVKKGPENELNAFLEDLQMKGIVRLASSLDLQRLAQMEAKTNQFNTTTPRFSLEQLQSFIGASNQDVLVVELEDRLAKHGLVSSIVLHFEDESLKIDNWLMSCRVFGRTLEEFIALKLLAYAKSHGLQRIIGSFEPTERNSVVGDLFPRLGFIGQGVSGKWMREVEGEDILQTFVSSHSETDSKALDDQG